MFNLSPYRSAVILPLQDAAVARSVNHKLFAHWRTFMARYCFPVFEVHAYFLRSLGAWAPHGALALFSSSDELNPEDAHWLCLHAQSAVSDTPWAQDPLSCLYYLRLPQEEVLWQELRWDTNAQPFDESQALISELRKVRYRCLNPMRHYHDDIDCIAVFPLRSFEKGDNRRRNLSMKEQLEWIRKSTFRKQPMDVLWVASLPGDMAPYGAVVFMTRGTRKNPMPLNRETLSPFADMVQDNDTARGIYFLRREGKGAETFRLADVLPLCGLCPMREPVPNIPRLLAEGHPHRYLCTWNTPYFVMPALRAQAYRPWKQYRDASNEICKIHFSARECI